MENRELNGRLLDAERQVGCLKIVQLMIMVWTVVKVRKLSPGRGAESRQRHENAPIVTTSTIRERELEWELENSGTRAAELEKKLQAGARGPPPCIEGHHA